MTIRYIGEVAGFFLSDNLYNDQVDFDLPSRDQLAAFQTCDNGNMSYRTVLIWSYGKLFHEYQFSSRVMKIDMSDICLQ